jgi:hypothetical protein
MKRTLTPEDWARQIPTEPETNINPKQRERTKDEDRNDFKFLPMDLVITPPPDLGFSNKDLNPRPSFHGEPLLSVFRSAFTEKHFDSTLHGSFNELRDVHDIQRDLVSSYIGSYGSHALLARGNHCLSPSTEDLLNFLSGDFRSKLSIDHFQVASSPATQAVLPVAGKLNKLNPGNGLNQLPGLIKNPGASTEITRIVVCNRHIKSLKRKLFLQNQFIQELGDMDLFKRMRIVLAPHLKTGGAGEKDLFRLSTEDRFNIVVDK